MRDYKREYAIRTKEDRNNRQKRRIARNLMIKKLGIKAVKGNDHRDGNPNNNSVSNLKVMSKSKNRSKK
jgi:hypothetical protein